MLATTYTIASPSNPILSSSTDASQTPLLSSMDASQTPLLSSTVSPETLLPNGVTIYGSTDSPDVIELTRVVNEFPKVWNDTGTFVDIPEDQWMKIPLRDDWESRMPSRAPRTYPVGTEDKRHIDKTLVATMPTDSRFRFNRYFASLLLPWNWGVKTPVRFKTWRRSVRELPRSR